MVYRIYTERKESASHEASALLEEIRNTLMIGSVERVRILNRYDVENITPELFEYAVKTVFSEPQTDNVYKEIEFDGDVSFAVEYLPGQFDQRADSASQCIQIISQGERPIVKTAKVYMLYGNLTQEDAAAIKKHVINPVEARISSLENIDTLSVDYEVPDDIKELCSFTALDSNGRRDFISEYGLAMDEDDVEFCRQYFLSEGRNPTLTEIKMIDTYWSDHCRHTTFMTTVDHVKCDDPVLSATFEKYLGTRREIGRKKPVNLMDMATIAVKYLRKTGKLDRLDESEEINACTVKIDVTSDGVTEPWLLLFKNETHNHPTEIEPFGGAATCIGGAIRDPLSGRAYVYAAMRLTGAADPTGPVSETIEGKLPQRKIVTTAANGYSSYGNQIGLATGIVDEIYHPGYAAKRMEIGAVIGAAPERNVRRERPCAGDSVILLGGRTGRDGCGGATGSSKSHTLNSLESCGAEVQKGNAPEERKLQRLFRIPEACLMIKRCNDFGAGGVSVAIGELADGLRIDLDKVPKKYEGLDGTELAISESQERMAVVVDSGDVPRFLEIADSENLEATVVASVTDEARLIMTWRGKEIVNLSREFLNSNGAEKHIDLEIEAPADWHKSLPCGFLSGMKDAAFDLNICSKRGLSERFDSTIGAGTVLMPFGGREQATPIQAMVHKISMEKSHTDDCSLMSWGYNPFISEASPYHGAYLAVVESVTKLIAAGSDFKDVYLTFQEYFEKLGRDSKKWGKPAAALLGAFRAQMEYGIGAVGGKDSMSGTFEKLSVPPTLVSFAVTTDKTQNIISNEFKEVGHRVAIITPEYGDDGLPVADSQISVFRQAADIIRSGRAVSAYAPGIGGIAEAVMKMSFGNMLGFKFDDSLTIDDIFEYKYGSVILELSDDVPELETIGFICDDKTISYRGEAARLDEIYDIYESRLEKVYPTLAHKEMSMADISSYKAASNDESKSVYGVPQVKCARPKVLIPVFPGTNCEYDTAKAMNDAGAESQIMVINNLTSDGISRSIEKFASEMKNSQIIFIPGGFSGGDEPDGSGKFITAFFRNSAIKEEVTSLLDSRGGLMCGICNGFQALIKLGLVPYGKIIDADENCPTLTFNTIGRHQSKIVRTRIVSNKSPWLAKTAVGDVYSVPVSHGEGRLIARGDELKALMENGQIATQYADTDGLATMDIKWNPNGSDCAVEGITSPDGRVFGKMGHSERKGNGLYLNVPGNYDMKIFESAVDFFKN